jgi:hypothetical protein
MPQEIQHSDRDAAVDDEGAQIRLYCGMRAVAPRTGEHRDRVVVHPRIRVHDLVHVLADARARAQGGPVVDENSHVSPVS